MNETGWATRHRRLILCVGIGTIAAWYGILLGSYLVVPALKDAIRARVLDTLRGEFASDVQFQSFDVSFLPRMHMTARGVLIGNNTACPLIQAATADAQSDVLPWHIRTLVLEGLSLHIPTAKGPSVAGSTAVSTRSRPVLTMTIAEIVSEHAQVEILPSAGQQAPLHFELTQFRATNFNPSHAADFSALIATSEPHAEIQTSGHVGPWNTLDPGATPVQGMYATAHCDLAASPGLKGTFSSQGRFRGALQRIEIAGDANAPEFSLSSSGPPEPLRATFQAAVDAWDGSVFIEQVQGLLRTSSFVASGFVRNIQDDRRRDIALHLSVTQGRVALPSLLQ
jgi:hypothetical protein